MHPTRPNARSKHSYNLRTLATKVGESYLLIAKKIVICGSYNSFRLPQCTTTIRGQAMDVFECDLAGSERFSMPIGAPGQRDARLPCIPEESFGNGDWRFGFRTSQNSQRGKHPISPRGGAGHQSERFALAPGIAGEFRYVFPESVRHFWV